VTPAWREGCNRGGRSIRCGAELARAFERNAQRAAVKLFSRKLPQRAALESVFLVCHLEVHTWRCRNKAIIAVTVYTRVCERCRDLFHTVRRTKQEQKGILRS